jgi:hypothetical protein|tara:strand:+ start:900 stop:1004 length:105 start_codon:yes stop_codon:yes gene_type:complete
MAQLISTLNTHVKRIEEKSGSQKRELYTQTYRIQ